MRHPLLALVAVSVLGSVGCSGGLRFPWSGGGGRGAAEPLLLPKNAQKRPDSQSTPDQDAVLRVLEELKTASKTGFDGLRIDAQPSAVTKMAQAVVGTMDKTDLGGCPTEFLHAFQKHHKAWKGFVAAVGRLPDGAYEDVEFMDSLYGLFRNDPHRGKVLGGDVVAAVKKVNVSYNELYAVAEGYGITAEDR